MSFAYIQGKKVVFFDGSCALCNNTVRKLFRLDRGNRLLFSPLDGETGRWFFGNHPQIPPPAPGGGTILYVRHISTSAEKVFVKSSAVIRVLRDCGGIFSSAIILLTVPKFLRDALYDLVARNRYKWFGKQNACTLQTDTRLRSRILP